MFDVGAPEILIVLVAALLLFGPRKLPELGRGLGGAIREFKQGLSNVQREFSAAVG